jgi:hypothetical protein|tara:strand:- start:1813 stop:2361 length:549 start_codon:yes stop_codon:yes gene_type:complete
MQQTKITAENRDDFYRTVYPTISMAKHELIDLDKLPGKKVLFDSAGWHYEQLFTNQKIIKLEHLDSCSSYKLERQQFDYIYTDAKIPALMLNEGTLVYDNGTYLKYKTAQQIKQSVAYLSERIQPSVIVLRMVTTTLNDSRFENRIQSFLNIIPDNFYFTKFVYNIDNVYMEMKIKKTYDLN